MNNKKLNISSSCFYENIENKLFILNTDTGKYSKINSMGTRILESVISTEQSRKQILEKFENDVNELNITQDINKFIDDLIEKKILIEK